MRGVEVLFQSCFGKQFWFGYCLQDAKRKSGLCSSVFRSCVMVGTEGSQAGLT
jgi:hypothetical protein